MNHDKFNSSYRLRSEDHMITCGVDIHRNPWVEGKVPYLIKPDEEEQRQESSLLPLDKDAINFHHEAFGQTKARPEEKPCKILASQRKKANAFDVTYFLDNNEISEKHKATCARVVIQLEYLDAQYVHFVSRPGKSDMHSPSAFRHEIAIPDGDFPSFWKDLE
jgi:hypothetical protein